jgi:hypothetical protein
MTPYKVIIKTHDGKPYEREFWIGADKFIGLIPSDSIGVWDRSLEAYAFDDARHSNHKLYLRWGQIDGIATILEELE